ncbi:hypothetical protein X747_24850 [Mesorhizobium sp. LNJC384A00]|uniref:hypothetical protein n=1 Tax=Mesorhizobium sp. LNJC384A00 TaxID=1287268 RepID=UPI0003CE0D9F|nr:hypothetical protein [Mesorhizobium sp. LNJC384A00]ESY37894.1 hypothetical protein X747_24850 [Mesorhizobium sp. LNJC384A00]
MIDSDPLFDRLTMMVEKTRSAEALEIAGWWDGDVAGKRRALDDMAAGRLQWRSAHDFAVQGLEALETGDRDGALVCAWASTDLYIAAIEIRIRPEDKRALGKASKKRGRPTKN